MVACGAGPATSLDAGTVESATCGAAPTQPEIAVIESAVDELGRPIVIVQRPDWDRLVDYETAVLHWTQCLAAH